MDTHLLPPVSTLRAASHKSKCCSLRGLTCCMKSKAACLIMVWNFSVLLLYKMFYEVNLPIQVGRLSTRPVILNTVFGFIAVLSPIAGLLADVKFSRFKTVVCSSYTLLLELLLTIVILIAILGYTIVSKKSYQDKPLTLLSLAYAGVIAVSFVIFIINAFQFGMDQLQDSSTNDFVLFIHWYVWLSYLCSFITEIPWNLMEYDALRVWSIDDMRIAAISLAGMIFFSSSVLLIVCLCVMRCRKNWFLLEPPGVNPYKLVYRVLKFAFQHKVPLKRSAFTYCEDELPSRLDLGKQKYGGPFTTKQVEDVKAFLGILKVLVLIGPAFSLQTVIQAMLPVFARHDTFYVLTRNETTDEVHPEGMARHIIISNGLLSPLLVVICIPLYLCLIRPYILYHIPGMLKRIGLGMILMILSLLCAFVMDFVVHLKKTADANCMFRGYAHYNYTSTRITFNDSTALQDLPEPLYQNIYFFISQHILSSLVNMLMDIAVLEFICSQSPYSMKGLVFGLLFSIKSLFQALAIVSIFPFGAFWEVEQISCGSAFYLINAAIAALELIMFAYVARKYRNRIVNEPSNEYHYAEEYYSNIR